MVDDCFVFYGLLLGPSLLCLTIVVFRLIEFGLELFGCFDYGGCYGFVLFALTVVEF